jgi:hypothetical protein
VALRAAPPVTQVDVPAMKTSIYIGSVTLSTAPLARTADGFAATYEAKVWPWFFWGETGRLSIQFPESDLARLAAGETVEFTGEASNEKHKPRTISGRAQPGDAKSGKIKVRIGADGIELIFNGTYQLSP